MHKDYPEHDNVPMIKISIWTNGGGRIYKEIPRCEDNIESAKQFMNEYEKYVNHYSRSPIGMTTVVFPGLIMNLREIAGIEIEGI